MNTRALEAAVRFYADHDHSPVGGSGDDLMRTLSALYNAFDKAYVDGFTIGLDNMGELAKEEIERVRWQAHEDGREFGHGEGYCDGVRDARSSPELADCIVSYGISNEAASKQKEYHDDFGIDAHYDAKAKEIAQEIEDRWEDYDISPSAIELPCDVERGSSLKADASTLDRPW